MKSPTGKGDKAEDCACCQQQVGDHWPSWRIWTFNYGKRLNPCRLFYLRVGNDGAFLQSSTDWPRSGISNTLVALSSPRRMPNVQRYLTRVRAGQFSRRLDCHDNFRVVESCLSFKARISPHNGPNRSLAVRSCGKGVLRILQGLHRVNQVETVGEAVGNVSNYNCVSSALFLIALINVHTVRACHGLGLGLDRAGANLDPHPLTWRTADTSTPAGCIGGKFHQKLETVRLVRFKRSEERRVGKECG